MKSRLVRRNSAAGLVGLAAMSFMVVACGSDSGGDDGDDAPVSATLPDKFKDDPVAQAVGAEVFNKALAEGKLTIYSGEIKNLMDAYGDENFSQKYGIEVEALDTKSSDGADRIRAENASGNQVADVYSAVAPYFYEFLTFDGLLEWKPPAPLVDEYPENMYPDPSGFFWPFTVSPKSVIVNTDMVAESDYPKSYSDLLDPKWKGKMVVRDPTDPGGGTWSMLQMWDNPDFGPDWVNGLKAQDPFVIPDDTCQAVVSGQFAIAFPGTGECNRDNPDAHVALVDLDEGQTWLSNMIGIIADSPHPNAAKVFETWIYQQENLQQFTNVSRVAPVPGITTPYPSMDINLHPLMEFAVPDKDVADPTPVIEEFVKIFGKTS